MKRKEETKDRVTSQKRKGFSVGPARLPDGVRKRKADKIKRDLIHKAKVRKEYAKVREREFAQMPSLQSQGTLEKTKDNDPEGQQSFSMPRHPDRENMINDPSLPTLITTSEPRHNHLQSDTGLKRRQKPIPFYKESLKAENLRAEAEERRKGREEAQLQRTQKLQEREQMRRAMAKARSGGRNGQRKLGRESRILLERVKKIVVEP